MVTGETLVDSQKSLINNDTLLNEKLKEDFEENVSIDVKIHEELRRALPDYEESGFQRFTWHIKSWHELDRRAVSPQFAVGSRQFKITYFPQGTLQSAGFTSIFLEYIPSEEEKLSNKYGCCCQFAFVISNPRKPSLSVANSAHCRFSPEIVDWGFTQFAELKKLLCRQAPDVPPIVEDGALLLTAYVRILKDPTGVLWHSFNDYDSKIATGYVGLKNQGATCYMNSLLQSLYIIHAFRRIVYQIPTDSPQGKDSIAYALQRCFYNLQFMNEPVSTTELTKSFGWDSLDSFMQHDVQEFNRVLQDNLERSMRDTKVENALTNLFVGKMKSYIACVNVNFESARSEDYWDIQLNVKGMKNLEDSFRSYIQVETLEGDNCYFADTYGFQEAKKGVIFESFPPILHLQLKRFEYDFERDMMIKINDRYEFPLEFDAKAFLSPEADQSQNCEYVLYGVLVHSGDLHNGHYYALLKTEKDGPWYKYDDTRVTRATLREVLEENYGGDYIMHPPFRSPVKLKRFMSAYMLLYLRKDKLDELMNPVSADEIPEHLKEALNPSIQIAELRRKERLESHLYTKVQLITPEFYSEHHEFDIADFGNAYKEETIPQFRIKKEAKFSEFIPIVAEKLGYPQECMRFWYVVKRHNCTVRVESPVNELNSTMEEVKNVWNSQGEILRLYLEITPENELSSSLTHQNTGEWNAFIFVKYFDRKSQEISGCGTLHVNKSDEIRSICPLLCERANLPKNTPLNIYEEIKPGMVDFLRLEKTFTQSELSTGDIICFEPCRPSALEDDIVNSGFDSALKLYDFLSNKVLVLFRPRFIDQDSIIEFEMLLDRRIKYDDLCIELGQKLGIGADHIRLTTCNPLTYSAGMVVPNDSNITLYEILYSSEEEMPSNVIFYETMDVSLSDLDRKRLVRLRWLVDGLANIELVEAYINKSGDINDLFGAVCERFPDSDLRKKKVRVYEVFESRYHRDLSLRTLIRTINPAATLVGEVVPLDQLQLYPEEKIVQVHHFHKDIARIHGIPFSFVIKPQEKFIDTKLRLAARTQYPESIFSVIKFCVVDFDNNRVVYLNDEDITYDVVEKLNGTLALDRAKKDSKKPNILDRAIQMKN
ncbi:hypothetical protein POMI540_2302 [Schizosaccharomyces pombe]